MKETQHDFGLVDYVAAIDKRMDEVDPRKSCACAPGICVAAYLKDDYKCKRGGINGESPEDTLMRVGSPVPKLVPREAPPRRMTLPTDSELRKNIPVLSGCIRYFAAALAGVAKWSKAGNDKHNPGQELHHARGKSMDHGDCIVRHLMDIQDYLAAIERGQPIQPWLVKALLDDADALSWRALALSQELHEKYGDAPLAPAARDD